MVQLSCIYTYIKYNIDLKIDGEKLFIEIYAIYEYRG